MSVKKADKKSIKKSKKSLSGKNKKIKKKTSSSNNYFVNSLHYKLAQLANDNPDFRMDIFPF